MDAVSHFLSQTRYNKNKLLYHLMHSVAEFFPVFSQFSMSHAIYQNVCSVD